MIWNCIRVHDQLQYPSSLESVVAKDVGSRKQITEIIPAVHEAPCEEYRKQEATRQQPVLGSHSSRERLRDCLAVQLNNNLRWMSCEQVAILEAGKRIGHEDGIGHENGNRNGKGK